MLHRILNAFAIGFFVLASTILVAGQGTKKELQNQLKERYRTDSFIVFLQRDLFVGEYRDEWNDKLAGKVTSLIGMGGPSMSTEYFHWYDHPTPPRGFTPLEDGKTFQHVKSGFQGSPIEPGKERLRIIEFRVLKDGVEFYLHGEQMRHGGSERTTTVGKGGDLGPPVVGNIPTVQTYDIKGRWGVAYHFVFPKEMIKEGNFQAIVAEIDKILQPVR